MRLIDNLLGTKGSAERTPFERAQYVVSMVFRILDWKDRMRRADPSAARLNKDNIVRLKLFFYRECLRFEPMGGAVIGLLLWSVSFTRPRRRGIEYIWCMT